MSMDERVVHVKLFSDVFSTSLNMLQVSMLFAEWYRICELPGANDSACAHFILQLHQNGLLKGDDMTERFFRVLTVSFQFLEWYVIE